MRIVCPYRFAGEKVESAWFLSIISDGSTDTFSKETAIVYVKTSVNCEVRHINNIY